MEGSEGNSLVPFTDITNIFVCKKVYKVSNNFDATNSDSCYGIYQSMCKYNFFLVGYYNKFSQFLRCKY